MSLEAWLRLLYSRFPREQFAQNVPMVLDGWNISQRHNTNTQAYVQSLIAPQVVDNLGAISAVDLARSIVLLNSNLRGSRLADALRSEAEPVRTLFKSFQSVAKRVLGSPASFRSLRSRVMSLWMAYGAYTSFITLNPSELHAQLASSLAGRPYDFDQHGIALTEDLPRRRPGTQARLQACCRCRHGLPPL